MDRYLGCGCTQSGWVKYWLEQERKRRALIEITGVEIGGTVVTIDFESALGVGYIEIDLLYGDVRAWRDGVLCRLADLAIPWRTLEIQLSVDAYCVLRNNFQCSALG